MTFPARSRWSPVPRVARVARDHGRLDVLVNDIFGGGRYAQWDEPLWEHDLTAELADHPVAVVGVTPGWMRSERMLENFGVTESTWREACREVPGFAVSESPSYVARGVSALAGDPDNSRFAGRVLTVRQPAEEYGFTDTDGLRPDCWGLIAEHGWDERAPEVIDLYR